MMKCGWYYRFVCLLWFTTVLTPHWRGEYITTVLSHFTVLVKLLIDRLKFITYILMFWYKFPKSYCCFFVPFYNSENSLILYTVQSRTWYLFPKQFVYSWPRMTPVYPYCSVRECKERVEILWEGIIQRFVLVRKSPAHESGNVWI